MPSFRTHYDTLKVAPDAPIEVIQAAYRSLARKYHPDHGAQPSPEREERMKAINVSYAVLSDPEKRAQHDQWIAEQMRRNGRGSEASSDAGPPPSEARDPGRRSGGPRRDPVADIVQIVGCLMLALLLLRIPRVRVLGLALLAVAAWLVYRARRS